MSVVKNPAPANEGDFISDANYGLTRDGEVVLDTDARSVKLLVAKGGTLPRADAVKHGLVKEAVEEVEPESKAHSAAPENKAHSGPAETKHNRKK